MINKGANPYTALQEWLSNSENAKRFEIRKDRITKTL